MARYISLTLAVVLLAVAAQACEQEWYNKCHKKEDCCAGLYCNNNNGAWADGVCTKEGGSGGEGINISQDQFSRACTENGYPAPSRAQYDSLLAGLPKGGITTQVEAAMAVAQFMHESDGYQAKREYRCQNDGCPNEYRTPGCDQPGQYYFGRGYIQLTWCYNYKATQEHLGLGNKLVEDPDSVAREEQLAWDAAMSFWARNVHNAPGVQDGQFGAATNAINGGLECHGGSTTPGIRFDRYVKIHRIFGCSGSPNNAGCN